MPADAPAPVAPAVPPAPGVVLDVSGLEAVLDGGAGVGPVDLRLAPGEQVLVLGPSGAGKSTLLRCLHGAVPHAVPAHVEGGVLVAGRAVAEHGVAALADVVGVLAQDPETGVCLADVTDEVAFPLENLGTPPDVIGPAVAAALGAAGAGALAGRRTDALSGGELQRVALAAAVVAGPRLLLLDEPTSMLDADGVAAVRDALAVTRAATGAACVLVEHRLDALAGDAGVAGLPGRWVVLSADGRVTHDGPAARVAREAGPELLARGCWLPEDVEIATVLGGAVGGPGQRDRVLALAAAAPPGPVTAPRGEVLLAARGLAAGRGGPAPRHGRRSRRGPVPEPVLRDVDLELRAGEVVALVGANGAGKSTLLACLAGLLPPLAGVVDGARAGLVAQNPEHQIAARTVRAEVAVGLPPGPATDARVAEALERFGLTALADRDPHRLSGGEQRRLSLAAMLVHDRGVLLADEPTFGLDRHGTAAVLGALAQTARAGRAVLLSCHDLRAVASCADRVLVLAGGRLVADVDPLTLLRDPRLLDAARLRPSRLLRWLAEAADDAGRLRDALAALDARGVTTAGAATTVAAGPAAPAGERTEVPAP
ncbi:ABC transporter ATP-binding protein [Cellulomonas sp. C5510]|uniref:ABC transporter ATP-binding protein n=1 Tax=Cellulomonas sp. C5510 TaxID=2871170 RepID=UPI001C93F118|nr:ABC transporter ATP-binding protein [Cellulomonas sp. C5510]QZN86566.1 ATP-binding cassette domain-containing protein [Cellulomonas sp. C5510]